MYKSFEELQAEHGSAPLSQGDILEDCPLVFWPDQTRRVDEGDEPESERTRVIILTQACDLANDKTRRVVVAQVHVAADLVRAGRVTEKYVRDNVRRDRSTGGTSFRSMRRARGSRSRWST